MWRAIGAVTGESHYDSSCCLVFLPRSDDAMATGYARSVANSAASGSDTVVPCGANRRGATGRRDGMRAGRQREGTRPGERRLADGRVPGLRAVLMSTWVVGIGSAVQFGGYFERVENASRSAAKCGHFVRARPRRESPPRGGRRSPVVRNATPHVYSSSGEGFYLPARR